MSEEEKINTQSNCIVSDNDEGFGKKQIMQWKKTTRVCYFRCMVREDTTEGQHLSKKWVSPRAPCFQQYRDSEEGVCLLCLRISKEAVLLA